MEPMQLSIVYQSPSLIEDDDDSKKGKLSEEQILMIRMLNNKKNMVVDELIKQLGHKNRDDIDTSLNACNILIDLAELDKTKELFFDRNADRIGKIIDLALDPQNYFN
jgi:hypothetical protein